MHAGMNIGKHFLIYNPVLYNSYILIRDSPVFTEVVYHFIQERPVLYDHLFNLLIVSGYFKSRSTI